MRKAGASAEASIASGSRSVKAMARSVPALNAKKYRSEPRVRRAMVPPRNVDANVHRLSTAGTQAAMHPKR